MRLRLMVSTCRKSTATTCSAWAARNCLQLGPERRGAGARLAVEARKDPEARVGAIKRIADRDVRAMVIAELYRHTSNEQPRWKLRAIGQGWADGLDGLARAHGLDVV
jgi:hypothetical protein